VPVAPETGPPARDARTTSLTTCPPDTSGPATPATAPAAAPEIASRRTLLRTAAAAGTAVAVAPALVTVLADSASGSTAGTAGTSLRSVAMRPKKRIKCKRSQVKVKGRCRPRKKKQDGSGPGSVTTGTKGGTKQQTPTPTPTPIAPGTMLAPADRHLVSRFSYGIDTTLADQVNAAGGAAAWFERQLLAGTSDPATNDVKGWWPSLSRTPTELWTRQVQEVEGGWEVMADYARYLLARRMRSSLTVRDVMTEFWENHLNVPVNGDAQFLFRSAYGDVIRTFALGRFSDLLTAAVTHPAMLVYLNAAVSTAAHPNENLGRELLELHTVGRGQYGEADVKASARILTGYRVDMWNTWAVGYRTQDHYVGPVSVMGFSDANASGDGRATTAAYLSYLAHHPATAQRLARKLAVKFVNDNPSQALVDQLAQVYLANDTAIAPVLRALVASSEFAASAFAKVRNPCEDLVATYKALGVEVSPPTWPRNNSSAESAMLWQAGNLGDMPHVWPRPDGAPIDNASWSSPSRILASLDLHYTMSGGWWPTAGMVRPSTTDWLPAPAVTFRDLVERLCNRMLHLPTPDGMLQACCQAVGVTPDTVITAQHALVRWQFPRLLTAVLDSPHHLKR